MDGKKEKVYWIVKLGNCIGSCPEIWQVGEISLPDEIARFKNRAEAEKWVREKWGEYPITCG